MVAVCFMWYLQELVTGVVVIQSRGELGHNGLTLTVDGNVNLQLSAKSVGMFEAFYNSLKVYPSFINACLTFD